MAPRIPALQTRRHRRRRQPHPFSWSTPHPGRSTLDPAVLDDIERIVEQTITLRDLACELCGRDVMPGTTAFIITDAHHYGHLACWTCGQALRLDQGFTTPAQDLDLPA